MDIEKALKQNKPFSNAREKVVVNLLFTASWLNQNQKLFFKMHDLTPKQYNILRILRGAKEAISTSEISLRMIDRKSDVSRIVDRLFRKGFVAKNTCDKDNRKVDVYLSATAKDLLSKMDGLMSDWLQDFSNLSIDEAEELSRLLDKMRK